MRVKIWRTLQNDVHKLINKVLRQNALCTYICNEQVRMREAIVDVVVVIRLFQYKSNLLFPEEINSKNEWKNM